MASLNLPAVGQLLASTSFTTQAMNANNNGGGAVLIAPKTGTIDSIGTLITAKTGTAPTYRFGVEGVSSGARTPDGTYLASGNAYVDAANPATGWAWRTLGSSISVTAGNKLAATVRYQTGTVDGSNFATLAIRASSVFSNAFQPYGLALSSGTWSVSAAGPIVTALRYDDGTVIGMDPVSSLANLNTWNSGTSPLYRGCKFTPSVACRAVGLWLGFRIPDTFDFNIKVFEGASGTPIATLAINADEHWAATTPVAPGFFPLSPLSLAAGTAYRFVVEPTTANNPTTAVEATLNDDGCLTAYAGDLCSTAGTSTPVWTDYDNGTDGYKMFPAIPVIDDVTTGGGGGGQRVICG